MHQSSYLVINLIFDVICSHTVQHHQSLARRDGNSSREQTKATAEIGQDGQLTEGGEIVFQSKHDQKDGGKERIDN